MVSVKIRSASREEVSYAYRLSIVCLGKSFEVALPKKDIQALKDRGLSILAKGVSLKERWGTARPARPAKKSQRRKPVSASSNGQDATAAE